MQQFAVKNKNCLLTDLLVTFCQFQVYFVSVDILEENQGSSQAILPFLVLVLGT